MEAIKSRIFSSEENSFANDLKKFTEINNKVDHQKKKIYVKKFKSNLVKIVPIADIHMGHKNCNVAKLRDIIDFVLNTKDCYCVLLGDQTECATKTSIGMATLEQDFSLGDQIKFLTELFTPLAKAGKILGINTGNHEYRLSQFAGIDPAQILAAKLEVPFLGWQGYLGIEVNGIRYDISSFHGVGGGTAKSSKIKAIKKVEDIADCDLYIIGHLHDKVDDSVIRYKFDYEKEELVPYIRKYALCGSFLEYWNSYSEMKALAPSITGSPLITLSGKNKEIQIYK